MKLTKLSSVYDNYLEHSDVIGNFNSQIFIRWKSQLNKTDENLTHKIKDVFRVYDDKKRGAIKSEVIIRNKQPLMAAGVMTDFQLTRFMDQLEKYYLDTKITESKFIKLSLNYIQ